MIGTILLIVAAAVLTLLLIAFVRTACARSRQPGAGEKKSVSFDETELAHHLSGALKLKTISDEAPDKWDYAEFLAFHAYLEKTYPLLHRSLKKTVVNTYSLLYEWTGSDTSRSPVILTGHMDVVPVSKATEGEWAYPAFSGTVADGFIWGRGAIDCKATVIGLCEAVEYLLSAGFRPDRTVYLAFGHDEEVCGRSGAASIVDSLKARGIKAGCVLDEGGAIVTGALPGVNKPAALIGNSEKGYMTFELSVKTEGGHSSTPPNETAIGLLSKAVAKLEKRQFRACLKGSTKGMFDYAAAEMALPYKFLFANQWLFKKLIAKIMLSSPTLAASVRTTTAVTIIEGGFKENVLPDTARAVVNFRVVPGEGVDSVLAHIRRTVGDPRVKITQTGDRSEPLAVSPTNTGSFRTIQKTIRQVFPGVVAVPYQVLGATDARHYSEISNEVYRFGPLDINISELSMPHGVNERVSVSNFGRFAEFYALLILNLQERD
jgi:carboxypeptidase PM20D1